jgi:hypothetical protein
MMVSTTAAAILDRRPIHRIHLERRIDGPP